MRAHASSLWFLRNYTEFLHFKHLAYEFTLMPFILKNAMKSNMTFLVESMKRCLIENPHKLKKQELTLISGVVRQI